MTMTADPRLRVEIDTEVIDVSPDIAREWLATNETNRKLRATVVNAYVSDMLSGRWHFTGDPIRFDPAGRLLDGQHRLTAVIQSDVSVPMLILRGVNPDAQRVMDTGARRTTADALSLRGHRNVVVLAAVGRLSLLWTTGRLSLVSKGTASNAEVLQFIDDNPDLIRATERTTALHEALDAKQSCIGTLWWAAARVDEEAVGLFFHGLATLQTDGPGDPRLALLRRLQTARRMNESIPQPQELSLFVRAYNAWREGKQVVRLQTGRKTGEPYPVPDTVV